MNPQKKYDVFISYSRKDSAIADKICSAFDQVGITYFIDRKGMGGTANYVTKIANEIDNSKMMLLLASANSYTSKYVAIELHYAFNHDVVVLPYALDDIPTPKDFEILLIHANWHYLKINPIFPNLLTSIAELIGKQITSKLNLLTLDAEQNIMSKDQAEQERLRKEKELQEKIAQAEAAKKTLEEKARLAEEKARKAEEKARKAEEEKRLAAEEKIQEKGTADPAKHTIEEEYQRRQQINDELAKTESSGLDIFTTFFSIIAFVVMLGAIIAVCWSPFALYGRFASNKFAERGHEYFYGTNEVQQDYAEAVKKYKHAVKGSKFTNPNYGLASYNLALCYEKGLGVEVNNEEAFERYRKSARRHNIAAMYKVADCYANGKLDVEKDSVKAIKWYKKASAENLEFSRDELKKTAIVRDVKEKHHEIMILPTKVKKCTVTTIGNYAFSKSSIKSIEIPEGVTTIENYAFALCDSLVEIVLPTSIVSIEENAFQGSTSLSKILIPSGTRNKFASMAGLKDMEDKLVETPTDIKQKQFVQDSIRQVDTQDGIAKQSKTDTNLITFNETKTTTKEPRQSIRERKPSNNVEEKLSQQMNQSKSPIKADSTYNKKIPNVTFDKKELQKVLEKFPTNLIADGLMYQKNATYIIWDYKS